MKKVIFLDRDGTLMVEPPITEQINSLEEMKFLPNVIFALRQLCINGFELNIVSNQDGLGTKENKKEIYDLINNKMLEIFNGEGIKISNIFTCPHYKQDNCDCRKPKIGMLHNWLKTNNFDKENSYMIGDRDTDIEFANNLGIKGFKLDVNNSWMDIVNFIINKPRIGKVNRITKETNIDIVVNLDGNGNGKIDTGIEFFNHMLEQIKKHGNFDLDIFCKGDLNIDEHHTIEDVAISLGEAFKLALGDKNGIERYGWERILVMDEAKTEVSLDLSGRAVFIFNCSFDREYVGDFPTEMTEHFFQSFALNSGINLNIKTEGKNTHHKIECMFKAFAKSLRDAVRKTGSGVISTKGVL